MGPPPWTKPALLGLAPRRATQKMTDDLEESDIERRRLLARLVRKPRPVLVLNAQFEQDGPLLFEHACALGCEDIVGKRKGSRYRSGRSRAWVESSAAPAVRREEEEDWGKERWR